MKSSYCRRRTKEKSSFVPLQLNNFYASHAPARQQLDQNKSLTSKNVCVAGGANAMEWTIEPLRTEINRFNATQTFRGDGDIVNEVCKWDQFRFDIRSCDDV